MKQYRTQPEIGEFKGKPVLSIWDVNEHGEKVKQYPIISFGRSKAKILAEHADIIKTFAESSNEPEPE
jgi:hypothetical protein